MNQSQDKPLLPDRSAIPAYNDSGNDDQEAISSPGLDEFKGWKDSKQAFYQFLLHGAIYILLGVIFYSFILQTKFTVIDSIYFSVCVFTTVGYGDISPDSSILGMVFTMLYALYGIIILGIFLGILGDIAIERQKQLNKQFSKFTRIKYLDSLANSPHDGAEKPRLIIYDIIDIVKGQLFFIATLMVLAIPLCYLENWSFVEGMYWLVITATTVGLGDEYPSHEVSKLICIFYVPLAVVLGGSIIGLVATAYVDKRDDVKETEFLGRALNKSALDKMKSTLKKMKSKSTLKKMNTNHDNKKVAKDEVTKDEFLCYMLMTLDKVDEDELIKICDLFDNLDKTGDGILTTADIDFIPEKTATLYFKSQRATTTDSRSLFRSMR